jgi:nitric oxide synthase-interacting protein
MARHSKNNTASSVFTYAERAKLTEYGTLKQRVGQDSQRSFEKCHLCLQKVIDPMSCCEGHIFCHDCIIENLVTQKKEIDERVTEWERKQKMQDLKKEDDVLNKKQKQIELFEKTEFELNMKLKGKIDNPFNKDQEDDKAKLKLKEHLQSKGRIDNKEGMIKNNFWVPETQEGVVDTSNKKPSLKMICPATKTHNIRMKELYKLKLECSENVCICAVCKKELKFQKIAMPTVCCHVMCKSCLDMSGTSVDHHRCPVCSKKFEKSHIVNLQEGWSAFTSHNPVQATKYNPSFTV